jgi:protein-S-isoprenylcysteine O-methyltransferase Ste14
MKTIRIFLLIIGNALALLLALLALETTPSNFMGWFLFAISIAYGAGGVIYLWRNRDEESNQRSESGNRSFWWIVPGFIVVFFAPPLEFLHLTPVLPRNLAMELAGLVIILFGLGIRVWTRLTIGGMYSGYLRVKVRHVLVTEGPYHCIRHPGYAGFLLLAIGLALGFSSLIGLAAVLFLLLPGLAYRMKVEEKLLSEQFGEEYRVYALKTRRIIPMIW